MVLLINRTDIAEERQISTSVNDKVLKPFIKDAQFVDIQKLLGRDFYNDLIRNYTDDDYQTLLNGGDYTYQSVTYTNVGLKAVIVHYTYARYVLEGSQIDTPFGDVLKLNPDSQPISDGSKKTKAKSNQQTAFNYWENVLDFLDRNSDDYSLWTNNCVVQKGNFRISKIGGTSKGYPSTASRFSYE